MEDGGKEDTAKPKEGTLTGKAGWLKKSSGKIFGTYKDRYIQLEHTEVVVYENEDLKTCLEKLDLENYDKCHELRGAFKKKNRLILIRAPKCANKVHDVKLQAQNQEEKEAWINAFSHGINRAKNKIFDEVKVEEGCSLEHVTRTRPKGNRGRRPPTRIHMKEVASISSDGILRLDLDVTDSTPNGTHYVNIEDSASKESVQPDEGSTTTSGSAQGEPTSEAPTPQKKVLKPPMPPSKQAKPASPSEEDAHGETTSDSGVDTEAPPTPSKPSSSQNDLSSDSSTVDKEPKPPKPPSKEKKPTLVDEEEAKETPDEESGVKEEEETEDKMEETETKDAQHNKEDKPTIIDDLPAKNVPKPSVVMWDTPLPETSSEAEQAEGFEEGRSTPELLKKSSGPPDPPKKKPIKCPASSKDDEELSDAKKEKGQDGESSSSELVSGSAETSADGQPESNPPSISPEPLTESEAVPPLTTDSGESVEPCELSVGKVQQEEQKSIDSGQHSAEESENGDAAATPTAVLQGSQTVLDADSSDRDETRSSKSQTQSNSEGPSSSGKTLCAYEEGSCRRDSTPPPSARSKPQILSPRPLLPLKPKSKMRSASVGDLLADPREQKAQGEHSVPATAADSDMKDLQSTVTQELKNTGDLLHTIADKQTAKEENQGELRPEVLLAAAMEKLRKADELLSVAKSFKEKKAVNKENKRISW
ncbi:hypothetical protein ACEWY4_015907 [Coilia grayii]|uniref:PH domain-containing protein n=1 Tax=Coilia grayii TaxID=363190 RepID=A0ABD1JQ66_9TELE